MSYVFSPAPVTSVPVVGSGDRFPVHRIYCVGRNYEEHAKEMGFTGREPPFFFLKPADAIVVADGTSCRHQIADGAAREAIHVARLLESLMARS